MAFSPLPLEVPAAIPGRLPDLSAPVQQGPVDRLPEMRRQQEGRRSWKLPEPVFGLLSWLIASELSLGLLLCVGTLLRWFASLPLG